MYNILTTLLSYNDKESFYFPLKKNETIPSLSEKLIGIDMKASYHFEKAFIAKVINQLDNGNPVMVDFIGHTVIFLGYKYTGTDECNINNIINNTTFIFHDPEFDALHNDSLCGKPYLEKSFNYLITDLYYNFNHHFFVIHYFSKAPNKKLINLHTIHLPDERDGRSKNNPGDNNTIKFIKNNKKIYWTNWEYWIIEDFKPILNRASDNGFGFKKWDGNDFLKPIVPDSFKWTNTTNNEISEFDNIEFKNIHIFNANDIPIVLNKINPKIAISFFPIINQKLDKLFFQTQCKGNYNDFGGYDFNSFKASEYLGNLNNIGEKFKKDIKVKTDFLMRIALIADDSSNEIDILKSPNYLDKFDLKFTYVPSQN